MKTAVRNPPRPRTRLRSSRQSSSLRYVAALALCVASLTQSCRTSSEPRTLRDKAHRVKELRREADDCWARWERSSESLEMLECFVEKHRRTTEIYTSPRDCPECFLNYGRGLRVLGGYYLTLRRLKEAELDRVSRAEVPALEEQIRESQEKVVEYYTLSNEMLEIYFGLMPGGLAYFWVSENYGELGDYDKALRFLKLFEDSWNLSGETLEIVEQRKKTYRKLHDREQLELQGKRDA